MLFELIPLIVFLQTEKENGMENKKKIIIQIKKTKNNTSEINTSIINTTAKKNTGSNEDNKIDLIEYGASLGVNVIEVSTLGEALHYLANLPYNFTLREISIDKNYLDTMKKVSFMWTGPCFLWKKLLTGFENPPIMSPEPAFP